MDNERYFKLQRGPHVMESVKSRIEQIFEPSHGKTNNLHRRKQRRRSASQ